MNHLWSETVNEQKQVEKWNRAGSPNPVRQSAIKGPAKSGEKKDAGCRSYESASGLCAVMAMAKLRSCAGEASLYCLRYFPPTGTAKYAVNTPVIGSTALPVISPLSFMSFASARTAE